MLSSANTSPTKATNPSKVTADTTNAAIATNLHLDLPKEAADSWKSWLFRGLSMIGTEFMVGCGFWQPYNQICEGLFVGMIPRKESRLLWNMQNQDEGILKLVDKANAKLTQEKKKERPLKLVVSAVEGKEFNPKSYWTVGKMVQKEDWEKRGIERLDIAMADFTANVGNENVIKTILKIRRCILDGGSVYIHCKAGRSRSMMLMAIYLLLFGSNPDQRHMMTLPEAKKLLADTRKQVKLEDDNFKKINEVMEEMDVILKNNPLINDDTKFALEADKNIIGLISGYVIDEKMMKDILRSAAIKAEVLKLGSILTLGAERQNDLSAPNNSVFFQCKKTSILTDFFNSVKLPNSDQWYFEMMNPQGLLAKYINENPAEKSEREKLVKRMRDEVETYLQKQMSSPDVACDIQDLRNVSQNFKPSMLNGPSK